MCVNKEFGRYIEKKKEKDLKNSFSIGFDNKERKKNDLTNKCTY